ncbi:hypothetical protein MTR67_030982 [Solanum verrucosum]|uniref:Uncharacterized protein n=1 Tax=Solanum verrucosum TaxID=315347 RepID=A0AAF0U1K6_SOLVR|nr:hypothetical protein MTR67_030982 [Solanum verrucosum]
MVNTRFHGVRPVAPVNAPAKESAMRGWGRGRVEEELWVEAGGRVAPTMDGAPDGTISTICGDYFTVQDQTMMHMLKEATTSVLSHERKDQIGVEKEQLTCRQQFREAILCLPMIQNTTMQKDRARQR